MKVFGPQPGGDVTEKNKIMSNDVIIMTHFHRSSYPASKKYRPTCGPSAILCDHHWLAGGPPVDQHILLAGKRRSDSGENEGGGALGGMVDSATVVLN